MNAIVTKALVWSNNHKAFVSPSKTHVWSPDDWTHAKCSRHSFEEILNPEIPVRMDDYERERWPCGCGLYGATEIVRVLRYKWSSRSLIFAMECDGNYEAWDGGLRCQSMRPVCIVGSFDLKNIPGTNPMHDYMQTLVAGCKYFKLPDGNDLDVIPYKYVKEWQRNSWEQGEIGEYLGD